MFISKQSFFAAIATILLSAVTLSAQDACGTDNLHRLALEQNNGYREAQIENEALTRRLISRGELPRKASFGADGIYYVPVVVHIIHTGEAVGSSRNPTDAKVQAAIDHTNKIFAAGAGFSSSVPFPVKFVLARRSPDCQGTNGIIRVDGSVVPGYAEKGVSSTGAAGYATDLSIKDLSRWPNTDYYNIWVVHSIQSYEGYAYYPGAGASIDGTVIRVSSINSLNTVLAHELGHGFNLKHTFEGDNDGSACPDTSRDCATWGDMVCDTEPHRRPSGCPTDPNPCTGQSYNNTQFNIMNYSSCKNRFTPGQRERFIAAFSLRSTLMNSIAWLPPGTLPASACTPVLLDSTTYSGVGINRVKLNNIDFSSTYALFEGALLDKSCSQQDTLFRNVSYNISVSTQVRPQNVRAYIDYNNNGTFEPSEKIFSSNGNTNYQTHNGAFTVPVNASLATPIRLRVISDAQTNTDPQPCGPFQLGQAEDYSLVFKESSPLAGIVAGIRDTICYEGSATQAGFAVLPNGSNPQFQWYYKVGVFNPPLGQFSSGWIAVNGATSNQYTPPAGLQASRTYACQVSYGSGDPNWAAGAHYTIVLPAASNGGFSYGSMTVLSGTSPGFLSLYPQAAGDRGFAYQWYFKTGLAAAPTGTSTAGWTLIPAGTTMPFDPGPITQNTTFACFVSPLGNPPCGSAGWASGAKQVMVVSSWFDTGKLARTDSTICFGGVPAQLHFDSLPYRGGQSGGQPGSRNYQYRWCYRLGIHDAPIGNYKPEWIVISGATDSVYTPGAQTEDITFACFISLGGLMQEGSWAEGCIQVRVLPLFDPGEVASGNQAVCPNHDAELVYMQTLPSGSGLYSYQWYYKPGTNVNCPSGDDTTGWTPIGDDTESSIAPGSINAARSFAVMITPGGNPGCGTAQWAEGCQQINLLPEVNYGTLEANDQYFVSMGDPDPINFETLPDGATNFSYQWYAADTLVVTATAIAASRWVAIEGAEAATYDPPLISASTSYACMVIPAQDACGDSTWAAGTRQVTIDIATKQAEISNGYMLYARPNPFTSQTSIQCYIPSGVSSAMILLYSIDGRMVRSIPVAGRGLQQVMLSAAGLESGIYFYTLVTEQLVQGSGKLVLRSSNESH